MDGMKRRSFSFALIFFGLFSFFQPPYRIDSQFHQYEDRYIRTRQSILLDATALFADEHRQNQQEAQKKRRNNNNHHNNNDNKTKHHSPSAITMDFQDGGRTCDGWKGTP